MRPSVHAMYRWIDFFPSRDISVEFARARRPGKKGKRVLVEQTPRWKESIRKYRGVYYLIAPCGAVFVVRKGEFIVDVFPMNEAERFVAHMQGSLSQYRAAMAATPNPGAQHGQEGREVMRDDAAFNGRIGRLSFTPATEGAAHD